MSDVEDAHEEPTNSETLRGNSNNKSNPIEHKGKRNPKNRK